MDLLINFCRFYFYKQLLLNMVHCSCVSSCGKVFASRRKLLDHKQRCKTCDCVARYRCGKCGKLFSTKIILKRHEMVHSDVRDFRCDICNKSFKCKGHLKQHGRVHVNVRNFRCHVCDETFKRKGDCIRHIEEHLGDKNYNCAKCGKGFARYFNARNHEGICCKNVAPVSDCCSSDEELDLDDNGVSDDEKI